MTTFTDLVLDTGELVRIEYPDKFVDDIEEAIENALKTRSWWSPAMIDGCKATYLGTFLDRVNMGRVVGKT
jgi:hypothetical protein